ncbi:hypothetical protein V1511DRAFT_505603 [Dipodascopsis uninucleata]
MRIWGEGTFGPLKTLGYLKILSMYYGVEWQAYDIYNAIAANYKCASFNVYDKIIRGEFPQNRFVSFLAYNGNGDFEVDDNQFLNILANDAGVRTVNVSSSDGAWTSTSVNSGSTFNIAGVVNVSTSSDSTSLAKQSWVYIDRTQYTTALGQSSRVGLSAWKSLTGAAEGAYAVSNANIYVTDRTVASSGQHNFMEKALSRPDLALFDLIYVVYSDMLDSSYTPTFMRSISDTTSSNSVGSSSEYCYSSYTAAKSISSDLTSCTNPIWAAGYENVGVSLDAFGEDESFTDESAAIIGDDYDSSVASDIVAAYSSSSSSASSSTCSSSKRLSGGQLAGTIVGTIVGGLLVIAVFTYLIIRNRNAATKTSDERYIERKASHASSSIVSA